MKIDGITFERGNDFRAILICEHCRACSTLTTGYHDNYYHTKVIPGMYCRECGKNRAGQTAEEMEAVR